ncbi:hypothetical protein Poli38472_000801 [Pythium oligandrum]|uniref:Beta-lactamase-related domain-containing protein n=1 Tax=Pythium oligandrum TaxID=41045 RepID=A0A8K1CCB2_PYTOL|nr:hypothetical protein Poli38472_000801 [Pythium oligandrum]|eukprot:TMW60759.1 hypothetical protein Poli38472_000801 [Pythium oligandrum]
MRYATSLDATVALEAQVQAYYGQGGFPKQGRSLKEKIDEAERFLAQEIPKSGIVGVGAAIVYRDAVVMSKGFGLVQASDSSSPVTDKSIFQIGSVSKTMIAVAVGLLVEEGKVGWRDPVKKHLPWLKLFDKYAEQHLNIGDLLAMNSGLGSAPDFADVYGAFQTERAFVEALQYLEPQHSLRAQPEYANINFIILGQMIESVSGQPWDDFLKKRIWEPLGMKNTFASSRLVSSDNQVLNAGHFVCDGELMGPYDIASAPEAIHSAGRDRDLSAAGTIVSSAKDMATFMRLLLNKGTVGDVKLLRSASTIAEMIAGKVTTTPDMLELFPKMGLHYSPDGSTLAAGYGIDIIGQAIWGYPYFDKSGDLATHQTRTGFAPTEKLSVILMGNTQIPGEHTTFYLDHYRTYVMGIFLDVPKKILDFEYKKWRAADILNPPLPEAPRCGLRFWKNPPVLEMSNELLDTLVGDYITTISTQFFPKMVVSRSSAGQLSVTLALTSGTLFYLGEKHDDASNKLFLADLSREPVLWPAKKTDKGLYEFDLGVIYAKQAAS